MLCTADAHAGYPFSISTSYQVFDAHPRAERRSYFCAQTKVPEQGKKQLNNSKRKAKDDAKLQEDHGERAKVLKKSKSHVSSRKSEFNDLQVRKSKYSKEEGVII